VTRWPDTTHGSPGHSLTQFHIYVYIYLVTAGVLFNEFASDIRSVPVARVQYYVSNNFEVSTVFRFRRHGTDLTITLHRPDTSVGYSILSAVGGQTAHNHGARR